jgi:hypothetical protein
MPCLQGDEGILSGNRNIFEIISIVIAQFLEVLRAATSPENPS